MNEQVFPSSFGQQRLWLLDQVVPGMAAYNLARAFHLTGSLDQGALRKALHAIIARHGSLRTVFRSVDDEVKQVVLPELELNLETSDITELPAAARKHAIDNIALEAARKPFDLSNGPLLRVRLLRLEARDHVLILVFHHIIIDGWSMNLLFHELGELYAGFVTSKQPQLINSRLQYSDYARWQHNSVTSESLADGLDYWKTKLKGADTVLQLSTDHLGPMVPSGCGKSVYFELSHETATGLKKLAKNENATFFMALLSIFQVLLQRYTQQDNILIGSPTAGRSDLELENVIGFFVNTLVLRADFEPDSSFRQILRQARETTLEALAHQDTPFERLVEVLDPDRNLNRNPLFQAMFVLHNTPHMEVELPGLVMQEIDCESGIAKFDLTLEVIDFDGLRCKFEYNSDLYEEASIQRMAGHFAKLAEAVVAEPDADYSKLSLLTPTEAQEFAKWNRTSGKYSRELCVHTAFEEQVARIPNKIAVSDQRNKVSYQELDILANRLARRLIATGIRPGALVGVSLKRSIDMVIALLGILKAGAAYLPLDPAYPEQRLDFMVEDSHMKLVVTSPEFTELWRIHKVDTLVFDFASVSTSAEDSSNLLLPLSAESCMYVIYTSGSTGRPKGIEGTHRASMNRFSWMWNAYPFADDEICCQKTALGFVDSIWEIFGSLLGGVPTVIIPDEAIIDPEHLVSLLAEYDVTRIVLVPSLLRIILEGAEDIQHKLPKLKLWTCSGESLSVDLADRFLQALPKATLLNIYGSSEVAADVTSLEIPRDRRTDPVSIGKPITNVQIFILDRYMNQVPIGVPGEIYVGGDCLAIGYLRRPELTKERFVSHSFEAGRTVRLFKTGDLARYLPNGEIEYLGRADNQVKIRGIRVELGEIETVLASHPMVRTAVVVLVEHTEQQRLTAYLEIRSGLRPDTEELRRYVRSKLPGHMVPSEYLAVEAFPLLSSGKIDRKTLVMQTAARAIDERVHIAPQTPAQERLAAIWRGLLKVETIGITDNFFELGGHSLMVMQVVARIRKEFEVEIPIRSLFEDPTITGLTKEVEEATAKGLKASPPISSFIQAQTTRDQIRLQVENMSREELEEMLRQILREREAD